MLLSFSFITTATYVGLSQTPKRRAHVFIALLEDGQMAYKSPSCANGTHRHRLGRLRAEARLHIPCVGLRGTDLAGV